MTRIKLKISVWSNVGAGITNTVSKIAHFHYMQRYASVCSALVLFAAAAKHVEEMKYITSAFVHPPLAIILVVSEKSEAAMVWSAAVCVQLPCKGVTSTEIWG